MAKADILENLYVLVLTPMVLNKRVRPAEITESFFSRSEALAAKDAGAKGRLMTRNAAKTFIPKWNKKVIVKTK